MDDKITISYDKFIGTFPDEESALLYLENKRWKGKPVCPFCSSKERITVSKNKKRIHHCNVCNKNFTVRHSSIFECSKIPLHKWFRAMYMLMVDRKGISSMELSKKLDITQKSSWFLLHRIREILHREGKEALKGIVEVDQAYIGGKEGNKHAHKKHNLGRGVVGKTIVLGMKERGIGGRTIAIVLENGEKQMVENTISEYVDESATIHSDEHKSFSDMGDLFDGHESVNHNLKEFVRGNVTTNGIESFWAVMKRGIHGTYHHIDACHTQRYANEFSFRMNEGNVAIRIMDRIDSIVLSSFGRRLTYKTLIA